MKVAARKQSHIKTIETWVVEQEAYDKFSVPAHVSVWVTDWCPLLGCSKYDVYWVRNNQVMMNREFILNDEMIVYYSSETMVG